VSENLPSAVNLDALAEQVHAGFNSANRARITLDRVKEAITSLDLSEKPPPPRKSRLCVRRLRIVGTKDLEGYADPIPINYDQRFEDGVNVLLISDNDVGKSSVMKSIRFALTGASDYDSDVRKWIADIWLEFELDRHRYTVLLSTRGDLRCVLVAGSEARLIDDLDASVPVVIDAVGSDAVSDGLRHFFFQRLGLTELSWLQAPPHGSGAAERRSTSWLTYFQALYIPDAGDGYLICDPQHAMGNQDGMILATYLGLSLATPLFELSLERSRTKRDEAALKEDVKKNASEAEQARDRAQEELKAVRARLAALERALRERRREVEESTPAQELVRVTSAIVEKSAERARFEAEREDLNARLRTTRAVERRLREAVALRLHFTGIQVALCPNCDTHVTDEAIQQEREAHLCRLCSKPALGASPQDVAAAEAELYATEAQLRQEVAARDAVSSRVASLRSELERLGSRVEPLQRAAQQGISYASPTAEEEDDRQRLHEEAGRLRAEIDRAERHIGERASSGDQLETRRKILDTVQDVLSKDADRRNEDTLVRLGARAQAIARQIGAESISDVRCSPMGKVQLKKHGQRTTFTEIRNQGERLRVKLAFFVAMMLLGREQGPGRHPGFLMIDQVGSAEMVTEDARELAAILRAIDADYGTDIQILCFTAREEFAAATTSSKVYGPQAGRFAF